MAFKISKVKGHPKFDSLPVAKIIDYPLERRDYKPYAQGRICINQDGMILQLWAFETHPEPESSLKGVFALSSEEDSVFSVEFFPQGEPVFKVGERQVPADQMLVHRFEGEDLQGVYWGATLTLPHSLLKQVDPQWNPEQITQIAGNLYKLSTGKRPHQGSLYPADFAAGDPFGRSSLSVMSVVSY